MQQMYLEAIDRDFRGLKYESQESTEKGHGRTEYRRYETIEIPADHPQRQLRKDLRTLAVATTCRTTDGSEHWETRYYVSSHPPRVKALAHAIRKHWSIENGQHWVLDITFGEDSRRQQDRHGAANLAAVRRLALSLLRQEKTNKRGVKDKRLACALDPAYLLTVLHNAQF